MGLVYIPTNVGIYSSPMDPMGIEVPWIPWMVWVLEHLRAMGLFLLFPYSICDVYGA